MEPEAMLAMLMSLFAGIAITGAGNFREIERSIESWILADKMKGKLKRQLRQTGAKA
jgi:hypothetical protein